MNRFNATALICLAAFATSAYAGQSETSWTEELERIRDELRNPISVKLANGRSITGHPTEITEEEIRISTFEGAGQVIFTFTHDQIASFHLPGESYKTLAIEWMEAGESKKARALMRLLFRQRSKLLPVLPPSESHFFIYYIDLILASPKPARSIAVAAILKPQIENPDARRALDDTVLKSYSALRFSEEARPLAETWVAERAPYGPSALGYYVLGTDKFRRENYEGALELALRPIVFSSNLPMEKLDGCYALAVSSALALRKQDYAVTLYKEMLERKLTWPSDARVFAKYYHTIQDLLEDT